MLTDIIQKHPTLPIMCNAVNGEVCRTTGPMAWKWTKGSYHKYRGYYRIHVDGKTYWIHRLIAETFLENPYSKPSVDHINRDPSDNRLENLRWATMLEQAANTKRGPLKYGFRREDNPKAYYKRYNELNKDMRSERKWVKYHFVTKMEKLMNW